MRGIFKVFERFSEHKFAFYGLFLATFLLHLGFVFSNTFIADDFLQFYVLAGDRQLQALGFSGTAQAGDLSYALNNQFNFYDAEQASFSALKDYGVLPWWMSENSALHLWRPLTSLTQWMDFKLWPESLALMHMTSLIIVLCAWRLIFSFYQQISLNNTVAVLAFIILIADMSLIYPLIWLAARNVLMVMLFLALTLSLLHLSHQHSRYLFLSLLSFLAALLSAEAGVVVGGFVAAYLLFYDSRALSLRFTYLAAFIAVAILWKVVYGYLGFGAVAVGNYVDPLQNPVHAILHFLKFYPLLLVNVFTGAEGLVSSWPVAVFGWLLLLVFIVISYRSKDKLIQFSLAAVVLSLVPYVSLYSSAPRFSVISHIAMALFLAKLTLSDFSSFYSQRWLAISLRVFTVLLLLIHIPLSVMGKTAANILAADGKVFDSDKIDKKYNGFEEFAVEGKHVIVLNAVDPFRMMFYPYRAAYKQQPLAASMRALVPAANTIELTRDDKHTFSIAIPNGLKLFGKDVDSQLKQQGLNVNNRMFEFYGFFHNGDYKQSVGQRFIFDDVNIEILATNADGQVTSLSLKLNKLADAENYLWLYWDWKKDSYKRFELPGIGQSIMLKGQL